MITFLLDDCKTFSQKKYDEAIDKLQIHRMKCSCGKIGCLDLYGHYHRTVRILSTPLRLRIQRVRCRECGKTHALFPSLIVPYSQIHKEDQQEILRRILEGQSVEPVLEKNFLIDENNVKYIVRQFRKHWEQRIASIGLTLADSLTRPCLSRYLKQFMQIHETWNTYFPAST